MLTVKIAGIGVSGIDTNHIHIKHPRVFSAGSSSSLLPPTERRRAGPLIQMAVNVANAACLAARVDRSNLLTVFSLSTAEPTNWHQLFESLADPDSFVSPTRFTNSVHNAASGYWHIAADAQSPSVSLAAGDGSFAVGLLEAATQCAFYDKPVLLVSCDTPYPEPLQAKRPIEGEFGIAVVLAPSSTEGVSLSIGHVTNQTPTTECEDLNLEKLRASNPAAKALPFITAFVKGGSVIIDDYLIRVMQ